MNNYVYLQYAPCTYVSIHAPETSPRRRVYFVQMNYTFFQNYNKPTVYADVGQSRCRFMVYLPRELAPYSWQQAVVYYPHQMYTERIILSVLFIGTPRDVGAAFTFTSLHAVIYNSLCVGFVFLLFELYVYMFSNYRIGSLETWFGRRYDDYDYTTTT